jgi:hypothetical protein
MKTIQDASHEMSTELAQEKGVFKNTTILFIRKNIKMRNAV